MGPTDPLQPYPSQADVLAKLDSYRQFGALQTVPFQAVPDWGMPTKPATVSDPMFKARNVSHEEILGGAIDGIDVDSIDKGRAAVKKAADDVDDLYSTFIREISAVLSAQWTGETGKKAADAISGYAGQSVQLVEAGYATSRNFDQLRGVMAYTKTNVPQVPDYSSSWDRLTSWLPNSHHHEAAKNQAKAQAQEFMDATYFGGGVHPTAASLTAMPTAQSPVAGDPNAAGYPPPSSTSSSGGTTPPGASHAAAPGTAGTQHNPHDGTNPDQKPGGPNDASGQQGAGKPSAGTDPNQIAAAGYSPSGDGTGLGSGAGLGDSGGLGGGSGVGGGGGAGSGGPLASPLLGGNTGASGAGSRPAAASAGRPGAPGMGGMPPAGGKKKEDDKTHRTKEYPGLYGTHNLEHLFETVDGQKVSPPVLGALPPDDDKPKDE